MNKLFNKKVIGILMGIVFVSFLIVWIIGFFGGSNYWHHSTERFVGIDTEKEFVDSMKNNPNRKEFNEAISLMDKDKIFIDSDISSIDIQQRDNLNQMEVAYYAYQSSTFNLETQGSQVTIEAKNMETGLMGSNVKLIIKLPKDFTKEIEIRSNTGSIDINGRYQKLVLQSNVGSIDIEGVIDQLEIEGDIGSIDVEGSVFEAQINTKVGSVDFETDSLREGNYIIATNTGSIDVQIPKDADAKIEATTDTGSIDCDAKMETVEKTGNIGKKLSARNKSGKASFQLSTNSGSISIED